MKNQNGQDTAECSKMKKEGVLEAKWGEKGGRPHKAGSARPRGLDLLLGVLGSQGGTLNRRGAGQVWGPVRINSGETGGQEA